MTLAPSRQPRNAIPGRLPARRPHDATRLAVLDTKLATPYRRPGVIMRPRVMDRLAAIETPVVAVLAPPGYGKSIAIAQWAEASQRPLAWLSADERDLDAAALLRGIAAAIDRIAPLDGDVIEAIVSPGASIWSGAISRLGTTIARRPPFVLVIDDIDRVGADAIDGLVSLLAYVGPGSQVVIAGRTGGSFPVARLAAQGQLTLIGRDDLSLDLEETVSVAAAAGVGLTASEVVGLRERTEGWAAGVYLSTLALRRPDQAATIPVAPEAPERLIEEYLRSEILATLSPGDATLLIRSSILDRVSGPLCDAILGRVGSGDALARLERANLFVMALGPDRTWYRYHHLLGDLLRGELERQDPTAGPLLLGRAGEWHEEQGLDDEALEYAMAAGDEERAVRLMARIAGGAFDPGRWDAIRRWFRWLADRGAGERYPRLAAFAAVAFALGGDIPETERWADLADRSRPGDGDEGQEAGLLAVSRATMCRGGVASMAADADLAVRIFGDDHPWRASALTMLGVSRLLQGDTEAAEDLLTRALGRGDRTRPGETSVVVALLHLAAIALDRGDRPTAEGRVREARTVIATTGLGEQAIAAAADALSARIAVHHGAIDQARSDLVHAQRLRPLLTYLIPWLAVRTRLDMVRVQVALADPGGARTLLGEVREILAVRPDLGTLVDEAAALDDRVGAFRGGMAGASTLTIAELRLLPLLTTHLSFREIGARLFVSQNTVKTQAISIYRKLEATSRGEAIERAVAIGLLDAGPRTEVFTRSG